MSPARRGTRKVKDDFLARQWPSPKYILSLILTICSYPWMEKAVHEILGLYERVNNLEVTRAVRIDAAEKREVAQQQKDATQDSRLLSLESSMRNAPTEADMARLRDELQRQVDELKKRQR